MTLEPMTPLDPIDRQLVEALQKDGRASYADLADLVGLSPAATRLRVQRLLDAGVVQVVGVTDPLALGYPVMAALGVRVERNVRAVADRIADIRGVIYVVFTSGSFDLLV
jgi:Lrp/AsnC family transcriptional regulator for asnA, asnC and gidA